MTKPSNPPTHYDEITRATTPVLDVFRPVSPPASIGERELVSRVLAALRADARLASAEIDVLAHGSQIWLTGQVLGTGTAAYAADIAARVEGVTGVHSELVIQSF